MCFLSHGHVVGFFSIVMSIGVSADLRHDVVGAHHSKERLSAAAQRCRAGLVVVSLKDVSHGSGKKFGSLATVTCTSASPRAPISNISLISPATDLLMRQCERQMKL